MGEGGKDGPGARKKFQGAAAPLHEDDLLIGLNLMLANKTWREKNSREQLLLLLPAPMKGG